MDLVSSLFFWFLWSVGLLSILWGIFPNALGKISLLKTMFESYGRGKSLLIGIICLSVTLWMDYERSNPESIASDPTLFFPMYKECIEEMLENRRTLPKDIYECRQTKLAEKELKAKQPQEIISFFQAALDEGYPYSIVETPLDFFENHLESEVQKGNENAIHLKRSLKKARLSKGG